jgi:hypothetical protein
VSFLESKMKLVQGIKVRFLETKMKLFPVSKRGGFFKQRSSISSNKQLIAYIMALLPLW